MSTIEADAPPLALAIWSADPDPNIATAIHRFGIEYEMFPHHYRNAPEPQQRHPDYCCLECNGDYYQYIRDRDWSPPMPAALGGEVADYIRRAAALGLASSEQHSYHCSCRGCSYTRSGPLMATQADCTVAVEMVSRILDVHKPQDLDEVAAWIEFVESWKADGHWMPDGIERCGNHIHVGRLDAGRNAVLTGVGMKFISAAHATYDWNLVADGGCGQLRAYNRKPDMNSHYGSSMLDGSWLSEREQTVEHRLWNTPRDPERLWAHFGLSIAMTRWGVHAQRLHADGPPLKAAGLLEFADHIDDFKRSVIGYLPEGPQFEQAAQLLNDHLVNY